MEFQLLEAYQLSVRTAQRGRVNLHLEDRAVHARHGMPLNLCLGRFGALPRCHPFAVFYVGFPLTEFSRD